MRRGWGKSYAAGCRSCQWLQCHDSVHGTESDSTSEYLVFVVSLSTSSSHWWDSPIHGACSWRLDCTPVHPSFLPSRLGMLEIVGSCKGWEKVVNSSSCYFSQDQFYNWSAGDVSDKHDHKDEQRDDNLDHGFNDDDHDGIGNNDVWHVMSCDVMWCYCSFVLPLLLLLCVRSHEFAKARNYQQLLSLLLFHDTLVGDFQGTWGVKICRWKTTRNRFPLRLFHQSMLNLGHTSLLALKRTPRFNPCWVQKGLTHFDCWLSGKDTNSGDNPNQIPSPLATEFLAFPGWLENACHMHGRATWRETCDFCGYADPHRDESSIKARPKMDRVTEISCEFHFNFVAMERSPFPDGLTAKFRSGLNGWLHICLCFLPRQIGSGHWGNRSSKVSLWPKTKVEESYMHCDKLIFIEGSLEVKLPTIWTDEKQSREEAERRERLEERRVEEKE